MTQPTRHPKSGVYRVRQAIPADLKETAMRLYGVRGEFAVNLDTRDPAEAKRRAPAALAAVHGKLQAVRKALAAPSAPPRVLTERDVQALAGLFYRQRISDDGDDPGHVENWEGVGMSLAGRVDDDPTSSVRVRPFDGHREAAIDLLLAHGFTADLASVDRLALAVFHADSVAAEQLQSRAGGDWRADPNPGRYPEARPIPPLPTPPELPGASLDDLLRGWAADRGQSVDARPIDRAVYDRKRTLERMASFMGHRDSSKITKADAVRWKQDMQARSLAVATVRNDLSEVSAIWTWAVRNGKAAGNPFEGVSPPKEKGARGRRRGYSDAEAATILAAARLETGLLRWLPWVCCLTGARLAEIVQSTKEDIKEVDGYWVIRIHDDGGSKAGRSIKNADSLRNIPLHPALVAEGFLTYVAALPASSALFPDSGADQFYARRAPLAGRTVSRWMKETVKLTDPTISPSHSWRHWFISAARRVNMNAEIRSAITGHAAKADESAAYGEAAGSFTALLAENVAKIRLPLV